MANSSEWQKVQMAKTKHACVHSGLAEGGTRSWGRRWQLKWSWHGKEPDYEGVWMQRLRSWIWQVDQFLKAWSTGHFHQNHLRWRCLNCSVGLTGHKIILVDWISISLKKKKRNRKHTACSTSLGLNGHKLI